MLFIIFCLIAWHNRLYEFKVNLLKSTCVVLFSFFLSMILIVCVLSNNKISTRCFLLNRNWFSVVAKFYKWKKKICMKLFHMCDQRSKKQRLCIPFELSRTNICICCLFSYITKSETDVVFLWPTKTKIRNISYRHPISM